MAFDRAYWATLGGETNHPSNAQAYTYSSLVDDATVSGYFDEVVDVLEQSDLIYIIEPSGIGYFYFVTSATGVTPVTTSQVPGPTPVVTGATVKYSREYLTTGGSTTEVINIDPSFGVKASDIIIASRGNIGAAALDYGDIPADNTVHLVFAADPGTSTIVDFIILSALH